MSFGAKLFFVIFPVFVYSFVTFLARWRFPIYYSNRKKGKSKATASKRIKGYKQNNSVLERVFLLPLFKAGGAWRILFFLDYGHLAVALLWVIIFILLCLNIILYPPIWLFILWGIIGLSHMYLSLAASD